MKYNLRFDPQSEIQLYKYKWRVKIVYALAYKMCQITFSCLVIIKRCLKQVTRYARRNGGLIISLSRQKAFLFYKGNIIIILKITFFTPESKIFTNKLHFEPKRLVEAFRDGKPRYNKWFLKSLHTQITGKIFNKNSYAHTSNYHSCEKKCI